MMVDTYSAMNVQFQPSQNDINTYMNMVDTNKDGIISLEEYEQLVLNSLKAKGITFD